MYGLNEMPIVDRSKGKSYFAKPAHAFDCAAGGDPSSPAPPPTATGALLHDQLENVVKQQIKAWHSLCHPPVG
jgi:hypothetical protein